MNRQPAQAFRSVLAAAEAAACLQLAHTHTDTSSQGKRLSKRTLKDVNAGVGGRTETTATRSHARFRMQHTRAALKEKLALLLSTTQRLRRKKDATGASVASQAKRALEATDATDPAIAPLPLFLL